MAACKTRHQHPDMPALVSSDDDSDSDYSPFCAEAADAVDRWLQQSKKNLDQHERVIKIYCLAPFLFGCKIQPPAWISYATQVGLLPVVWKMENCLGPLPTEQLRIINDLVEKAIDLVIDELNERRKLMKILELMKQLEGRDTLSAIFPVAKDEDLMKEWTWELDTCNEFGDMCLFAVLWVCRQYTDHFTRMMHKGENIARIHEQLSRDYIKVEKEKNKGNEQFNAGNYGLAVATYSEAVKESVFNYYLYGNRAQTFIKLQRFQDALCDGKRCVILNPEWSKGHYRYVQAWFKLGNLTRALQASRRALEHCPKDVNLQEQKAKLQREQEKRKDAASKARMARDSGGKVDNLPNSRSDSSDSESIPNLTSDDETDDSHGDSLTDQFLKTDMTDAPRILNNMFEQPIPLPDMFIRRKTPGPENLFTGPVSDIPDNSPLAEYFDGDARKPEQDIIDSVFTEEVGIDSVFPEEVGIDSVFPEEVGKTLQMISDSFKWIPHVQLRRKMDMTCRMKKPEQKPVKKSPSRLTPSKIESEMVQSKEKNTYEMHSKAVLKLDEAIESGRVSNYTELHYYCQSSPLHGQHSRNPLPSSAGAGLPWPGETQTFRSALHFSGVSPTGRSAFPSSGVCQTGGSTVPSSGVSQTGGSTVPSSGVNQTGGSTVPSSGVSQTGGSTVPSSGVSQTGGSTVPSSGVSQTGGSTVPSSGVSQTGGSTVPSSGVNQTGGSTVPPSGVSQTGGSTVPPSGVSQSGGSTVPSSGVSQTSGSTVPSSGVSQTGGSTVPSSGVRQTGGFTISSGVSQVCGSTIPSSGVSQTSGSTVPSSAGGHRSKTATSIADAGLNTVRHKQNMNVCKPKDVEQVQIQTRSAKKNKKKKQTVTEAVDGSRSTAALKPDEVDDIVSVKEYSEQMQAVEAVVQMLKDEAPLRKKKKKPRQAKTAAASKASPLETPVGMSETDKQKVRSEELRSHMKQGTQALFDKHHSSAVCYYNKALHLIKDYQIKVDEVDLILLKYSIGVAYVGIGHVKDLKQAICWYTEIVDKHSRVKMPLSYLGLGKAYHRWNRFTDSLEPLRKGLKMVSSIKQAKEKPWPGSDTVIEETKPGQLKVALETYLKLCMRPPPPDAVCRYTDCNGYYKVQIYHSDPDFKGYVRVICFAKCIIEYHIECWKAVKSPNKEKISDKELLCRSCFTPDCSATIWRIITFDHTGDKSREIVATREKEIKPKPKNHKLRPSNQVKIAMRKERKRIRKIKREEARSRMEKEESDSETKNPNQKTDPKSEQIPNTDNAEVIPVNLDDMTVLKKPENKDEDFYKVIKPSGKNKGKKKQKVKSVMTLEEFVGHPEGDEMPSIYEYTGLDYTNYDSDSSSTSTPYSQYSGSMGLDNIAPYSGNMGIEKPPYSGNMGIDNIAPYPANMGIDKIEMPPLPTNNPFSRIRLDRTSESEPSLSTLNIIETAGEPTTMSLRVGQADSDPPPPPGGCGDVGLGGGDSVIIKSEKNEYIDSNPPAPTVDIKDQIFEIFATFLKQRGPMHLKDVVLLDEVNQLQPEAQKVIETAGCIGKFLKQSMQFSLIDNFICLMQDAVQARQLARDRKKALLQKSRSKQAAAKSKIQLKSTENISKAPSSPAPVKQSTSRSSTSSSTHSPTIFSGLSGDCSDGKKSLSALDYFDSTKPVGKMNESIFFGSQPPQGNVDLRGIFSKRNDEDERGSSASADGSSSLTDDRRKQSGSSRTDDYYASDGESGTSELQDTQSSGSSSNTGEVAPGISKTGLPNLTNASNIAHSNRMDSSCKTSEIYDPVTESRDDSGSANAVTSLKSNLKNSSIANTTNLISSSDDSLFSNGKTSFWDRNKCDLAKTEIVDSIQLPPNYSQFTDHDGDVNAVGDPGKLNGNHVDADGGSKSNSSTDGRYMETNRIWGRQSSSSPSVSTPGSASPVIKQNGGSKDYLSDITSQPLAKTWQFNSLNDNPIPIPDVSKPPPGFGMWAGTATNWSSVLKQGETHCKESQLLKEAAMREAFSLAPGSPSSVGHVGAERTRSDSGKAVQNTSDCFPKYEVFNLSPNKSLGNSNQSSFAAFANPTLSDHNKPSSLNQDVDYSTKKKLEKVDEGLMNEVGEDVYKTLHSHQAYQSKPSLLGDIMRDIRRDFKASHDTNTHFPSVHEPTNTNTSKRQTHDFIHIPESNYNKPRVEMVDKWVNTDPYKPDSEEMDKLRQQRDTYYADVKNAIDKYAQLQSVYNAELEAKKAQIYEQQKEIQNVKEEMSLVTREKDDKISQLQVEKEQLMKQIRLLAGKIEETKVAERRLTAELKLKERDLQVLSENQQSNSMGYSVDHYREELEHLQQSYTTELSRAEAAEAQLLQAKYDLGAQTLENSYKHAELVIKQLSQLINMYQADDTPVPRLLHTSLDQWNANVEQIRKTKNDYLTCFEEKLRQVKAGNPLDTLSELMGPQPPAPPQSPSQVAMFFQSGRGTRGLNVVPSDLGWSGTPAARDAVSEQPHVRPDSISAMSSVYGVSDSASAPSLRLATPDAKKPGKKKKSSFSNILDSLTSKFTNTQKSDIERHLRQLRAERNGSLSGMRVDDIQQQVSERIRQDQLTLTTEVRLRPPPGLGLQFADIVSGRGALSQDNSSGRATPSSLGSEIFEDDEDPCIICHEQMKPRTTKELACGHRFHFECIKKWLREQSTCPVCRVHALLPEEFPSLSNWY